MAKIARSFVRALGIPFVTTLALALLIGWGFQNWSP